MRGLIKLLIIFGILGAIAYGAYIAYDILIEDATKRIRQGVAKGVGKGIKDMINPFKW